MRAAASGRAVLADPVHGATRAGAITINRLVARAAAGAIPTRADAWTDVRVPPGLDPADVVRRLRRELRRGLPPGVTLTLAAGTGGAGMVLAPHRRVRGAVDDACRTAYGRPAVSAASGGSVRAVEVLRDVFGQSPVLLGLGPADDGAHGPDEYLDLREWPAQVDVHTVLLARLAAIRTPRSGQRFGSLPSVTVQRPAASWGSESALQLSGVT